MRFGPFSAGARLSLISQSFQIRLSSFKIQLQ